jgi:hypothetical protein
MRKTRFAFSLTLVLLMILAGSVWAVTIGQPDDGHHPYVGLIVFDADGDGDVSPAWRCSGALLSPTVILTAGHCTRGAVTARVWFDEHVQDTDEYPFGGATSYEGIPHTYPDFCNGCRNGVSGLSYRDIGIVVLSEPVPTSVVSDYAELPTAGLVDSLAPNANVDLIGYGVQEQTGGGGLPVWSGLRVRLYAPTQLVSGNFVHSDEFIRLTANPRQGKGGTCFGDSGGPDLLGGTDTVLAVNSYVTSSNCAGVTSSSRVDIPEVLEWIEGFLA